MSDGYLNYSVGQFLYNLRVRNAIVDATIDIERDTRTYLRAEVGETKPQLNSLTTFFDEMGFRLDQFETVYHKILDPQGDWLAQAAWIYLQAGMSEQAEQAIHGLADSPGYQQGLKRQMFYDLQAQLSILKGEPLETTIGFIERALRISYPAVELGNLSCSLLMPQELRLVHTLSIAYLTQGELDACVALGTQLVDTFDAMPLMFMQKDKLFVEVLVTLVQALFQAGAYDQAWGYLEKAKCETNQQAKGHRGHQLALLAAQVLLKLGQPVQAKSYFNMAYFSAVLVGYPNQAEWVQQLYHQTYGTALETHGAETLPCYQQRTPEMMKTGEFVDFFDIGHLFLTLREQAKLSQKVISQGICDRTVYAKFESPNGSIAGPSIYQKENLLERLGRYPYFYTGNHLREKEFEADKAKRKIVNLVYLRQFDEALRLIDQIKDHKAFKKGLGLQFILSQQASALYPEDPDEKLKILEEAIALSIPNFSINQIENYRLCLIEIRTLNKMAVNYGVKGDSFTAVTIIKGLLGNIDKHYVDEEASSAVYTMLLLTYSKIIFDLGKLEEVKVVSEKVLALCRKYGYLDDAVMSAIDFGAALVEQGETKKSIPYLAMGYWGSLITNREFNAKNVQYYMEARGLHLSEWHQDETH